MLAKVYSGAIVGLDGVPVEVEVDIASQGLPNFFIVGLPDKSVDEAKERVRSAIRNSGADLPARRITIILAPADLPKEGPSYDLPIALGVLLATEQIQTDVSGMLFTGELSLDGRVRPTPGVLSQTLLAKAQGYKAIFVPSVNVSEASIIDGIEIYPVDTLLALFHHLRGEELIKPAEHTALSDHIRTDHFDFDMADIKGQHTAKRALEIAAAGGHNMLLKGPPGAGKTLLARTLPSILPNLTLTEALEVTNIYSISGMLEKAAVITKRPFRSPHHTTSLVGLIGGSSNPRPGEITLAHRGVLFLDELPEFPRNVLETLRQPIEDGSVTISRASGKYTFPTKCMLIAAQNPCPCGYLGDKTHHCTCNPSLISKYQKKISGPLLDRIDIHLDVPAVRIDKLTSVSDEHIETSTIVRSRVQRTRDIQFRRFAGSPFTTNAEISSKHIKTYCPLSPACLELLKTAVTKLNLSARSYNRTIKLARTIADLVGVEHIEPNHIAEALQYRPRGSYNV